MEIVQIILVITGGLLVFGLGRFAQAYSRNRHCAAWGCGAYFFLVICIIPLALFGDPEQYPYNDGEMFGNDEWYGWIFFWTVLAGIAFYAGQYLHIPDDFLTRFEGPFSARRQVIKRVYGTSNTRDVIGPLVLDTGLYLLKYELKGKARSFPAMTVTVKSLSDGDYFDDSIPEPEPLVRHISTGEKQERQRSGPGICSGTEPLQLSAGHYLFEITFQAVQEWEIVISRADLRKTSRKQR